MAGSDDRVVRGRELLGALIGNPHLIEEARARGITPEHFDSAYKHDADWRIIEQCWSECQECGSNLAIERLVDEGLSDDVHRTFWSISKREKQAVVDPVDDCTKALVALGPYVKPPPIEYYTDPNPTPASGTPKTAKKKPQSKGFADRRSRWRQSDLKIIVRYSAEVLGKRMTLKALEALFPNRDIYNPEDVTGADVGNKLELTVERIFKLEELASAYRVANNYAKPTFAFRTITACDNEAEELGRQRQRRRNQRVSNRRREKRAEQHRRNAMLSQAATATAGQKTFAGIRAEQKAQTKAQCDALYELLDADEYKSVSFLAEGVRRHSAWRTVPSSTIERDIRSRLDLMTAAGRVENDWTRGSPPRRLVRRAKSDCAAAQPRK